jgi:AraC-like DNA-binding protein
MLKARYFTHSFARHTHEGYAIGVIESGVEEFSYRGALHRAPAGSVVVIHPGEVHTGHAGVESGWSYRMLYPSVECVQQAIAGGLGSCERVPYFGEPIIHDPELAAALRHMHFTLETATSRLEQESRFLWMLNHLVVRHADSRPFFPPTGRDAQAVQQVREYLHAHVANPVSLADLAHLTGLKPLRVLRLFQKQMGLPPHAYLIQVRVQHAKQLLQTGLAIAQVAADTGFTDQSHLNRHFKRLVGVTPGQYGAGCQPWISDAR